MTMSLLVHVDCSFTCHPRCAEKVFTKCISSNTADDPDEAKLNHRIPHRFETFTNLSPNWCYHCGHMLTFGRRHKMCSGMYCFYMLTSNLSTVV
jgi:classical protein kinase C